MTVHAVRVSSPSKIRRTGEAKRGTVIAVSRKPKTLAVYGVGHTATVIQITIAGKIDS